MKIITMWKNKQSWYGFAKNGDTGDDYRSVCLRRFSSFYAQLWA